MPHSTAGQPAWTYPRDLCGIAGLKGAFTIEVLGGGGKQNRVGRRCRCGPVRPEHRPEGRGQEALDQELT